MHVAARSIRFLIVGALAVCLGMAGLPMQLAFADAPPAEEAAQGPDETSCCCGTEQARCCMTACCQTTVPTPEPVRLPERPEKNPGGPLDLPRAAAPFCGPSCLHTRLLASVIDADWREGASLQAQQVRHEV